MNKRGNRLTRRQRTCALKLPVYPSDDEVPIGARLAAFLPRWQALLTDRWILSIVREGLNITFSSPPPLTRTPVWIQVPGNQEKAAVLRAEVASLLLKQAIEVVEDVDTLGFYSHMFVVPKPGGKWRPIIDLSVRNTYIQAPRFRMETAAAVRASMNQGDFAIR